MYIGARYQNTRIKQALSRAKEAGYRGSNIVGTDYVKSLNGGEQQIAQGLWRGSSQYGIREPKHYSSRTQYKAELKYTKADGIKVYGNPDTLVTAPKGSNPNPLAKVNYSQVGVEKAKADLEQLREKEKVKRLIENKKTRSAEIKRQIFNSKEAEAFKKRQVSRLLAEQEKAKQTKFRKKTIVTSNTNLPPVPRKVSTSETITKKDNDWVKFGDQPINKLDTSKPKISAFRKSIVEKQIEAIRDKKDIKANLLGDLSVGISYIDSTKKVVRAGAIAAGGVAAGAALTVLGAATGGVVPGIIIGVGTVAAGTQIPKIQDQIAYSKQVGPQAYKETVFRAFADTAIGFTATKLGSDLVVKYTPMVAQYQKTKFTTKQTKSMYDKYGTNEYKKYVQPEQQYKTIESVEYKTSLGKTKIRKVEKAIYGRYDTYSKSSYGIPTDTKTVQVRLSQANLRGPTLQTSNKPLSSGTGIKEYLGKHIELPKKTTIIEVRNKVSGGSQTQLISEVTGSSNFKTKGNTYSNFISVDDINIKSVPKRTFVEKIANSKLMRSKRGELSLSQQTPKTDYYKTWGDTRPTSLESPGKNYFKNLPKTTIQNIQTYSIGIPIVETRPTLIVDKTKQVTSTQQISLSKTSTISDSMQTPKAVLKLLNRPATIQATSTNQEVDRKRGSRTIQIASSDVVQKQETSIINTSIDFIPTQVKKLSSTKKGSVPPPPPPPIQPLGYFNRNKEDKQFRQSRSFNVLVRRRGIFTKIGKATSIREATNIGVKRVRNTAAASFRIIDTKSNTKIKPTSNRLTRTQFYESKKEPLTFIQRNKFRISTPGEKKEIPFKGKFSKKSKKNIFGL